MSKFSKHIGIGEPLIIDKEEFILKPLGTEQLPLFFKVMKAFSGAKEGGTTEDMMKNVDDAGLKAMQDIIELTLSNSFPDEPEDERKQFGLKYMQILLPKIMEINSVNTGGEQSKADRIKTLTKR